MDFAKRFTELLNKRGLTAYKLANELDGISETMIGKWKKGTSLPSFEKILILSNYLCVTTDYLIKGSDSFDINNLKNNMSLSDLSAIEENIITIFRNLDKKNQQEFIDNIYELKVKNKNNPNKKSSISASGEQNTTNKYA